MMHLYNMVDEYDKEEDKIGMKIQRIKNKAAASVQITAEQLIKESQAHKTDDVKIPLQRINDEDELQDYKLRKRKEFEDQIKRQRYHIGCWMKYAIWEENLNEFQRARSVYERAIEMDYKNTTIWLKYAEMEMRNKFINHARNVWERACKYLPRVDQFWYKFAYMEEILGNYLGAREIFEKWMTWKPNDNAWMSYAKFEERMGDINKAREVLYRYIECHNKLQSYQKVAKFEAKHNNKLACRRLYESALSDLGDEALNEDFFISFIKFEVKQKEFERARVLFKFGLDHILKEKSQRLYKFYVKFEKMHGTKESIEEVIYAKRRLFYEKELEKNPMNYDVWFDYTRLEENAGDIIRVREIYERAIMNIPPIMEKKYWRRYIFLWINYSVFEELIAKSIERTNEIFKKVIEIIPHEKFTFSKLFILYAQFLIRNKNIEEARKVLGFAIGKCPREKIFKAYIELELQLGNIDRVRKIYERFIECQPENSTAWIKYAELERSLDEMERCRAILEIAIQQNLDMPEIVWKTYINIELTNGELEKVRALYGRLLGKTKHVKVWISYAKFEQENQESLKARAVYENAYLYFKQSGLKEERLLILENWISLEESANDDIMLNELRKKLPTKVKRRRKINKNNETETITDKNEVINTEEGWEEYFDYIFPDDEDQKKNLKILDHALKWHSQKNN